MRKKEVYFLGENPAEYTTNVSPSSKDAEEPGAALLEGREEEEEEPEVEEDEMGMAAE